jgi:transposase
VVGWRSYDCVRAPSSPGPRRAPARPARATLTSKARSLGDAAAAAAKTNTFLGERYRRIVKRRGKLKALVAVARSILVIVSHLLANPATRFRDLGPDYHTCRIATERRMRNQIVKLTAMGFRVTLEPAV